MAEALSSTLLLAILLIGIAILYYLMSVRKLLAAKKQLDSDTNPSLQFTRTAINADTQILPDMPVRLEVDPDIMISPLDSARAIQTDSLPADLYLKIESLLKAMPALASGIASSGKLFRITFSPDVAKGLSDGSFALMQSGKGFKAIAVDQAGKIVEQGQISADRIAGTVTAVGAIWQIMSIVTAQKFLSDINIKLAGIEETLKGLETWLDTQEQGRFLGSMKYLSEVITTSARSPNALDFLIVKGQTERIYHESLQAIAANRLRAQLMAENILKEDFGGNLKQNTTKFRDMMDSYFSASSYAIRFATVGALSEYLSTYIDRNSEQEFKRIKAIIKDSEEFIEEIRRDAKMMKEKASRISGGWWDLDEEVNEGRRNLNDDMETLLSSCENALSRIRSVSDETKKIGEYSKELGVSGLSLAIEMDKSGKLINVKLIKALG